jgi:hypothetical protein
MRKFEVEYITTLPPWRFGYEKIEAENATALREKFKSKHEAAKIRSVKEIIFDDKYGGSSY